MARIAMRRILALIPLMLILTFAVFVLVDLSPIDPAERLAGETASLERIEEVREQLGLNEPLLDRYGEWASGAITGDFGESVIGREPVWDIVWRAVPATASLVLFSIVISTIVGFVVGTLAAMRVGGVVDRLVTAGTSVAVATPSFWLAVLMVYLFALKLGWLPAIGYEPFGEGVWPWFEHLILPSLALSAVPAAELARQLRGSLVDEFDSHYVLAAKARGIPRRSIVARHALKNAALPVVTIPGFRVSQLIGSAVIIERVFAINGLGSVSVTAAFQGDMNVILGITVVTLIVVALANLLVDLSYGLLNPRVRLA